MDKIQLSKLLDQTTYVVKAYENGELYSEGSGFCFNIHGWLITAAHVITGRMPIKEEDYKSENIIIKARTKKGPLIDYQTVVCGITIDWPDGPLSAAIQVDLAILQPIQSQTNILFLEIDNETQAVGTEVLMSGFPDELELPLQWDKLIDLTYLESKQPKAEIDYNMERIKELLMMI